jgi:ketosteroid isomerase-like protein
MKILSCKNYLLILITIITIQCSSSKTNNKKEQDPCRIINTLMGNQITSWNNGDIDAYMEFYWKSDSLQFIGSKGLTYGWDTTLFNYKKTYSSKEKMGELDFSNLNCKDLKNNSFLINGKWHLKRNEELKDLEGFYTLIWRKIDGQWKIVYDHSS